VSPAVTSAATSTETYGLTRTAVARLLGISTRQLIRLEGQYLPKPRRTRSGRPYYRPDIDVPRLRALLTVRRDLVRIEP